MMNFVFRKLLVTDKSQRRLYRGLINLGLLSGYAPILKINNEDIKRPCIVFFEHGVEIYCLLDEFDKNVERKDLTLHFFQDYFAILALLTRYFMRAT